MKKGVKGQYDKWFDKVKLQPNDKDGGYDKDMYTKLMAQPQVAIEIINERKKQQETKKAAEDQINAYLKEAFVASDIKSHLKSLIVKREAVTAEKNRKLAVIESKKRKLAQKQDIK